MIQEKIALTDRAVELSGAKPTCGTPVLRNLFLIFFSQLVLLILVSFIAQSGPVFVVRFGFGRDYYDFFVAAIDWLHHVDPYLRGRLYSPPSSILVGLVLCWLPFKAAALVVFFTNLALISASLISLGRRFGLSKSNQVALFGIAATFYPFYFLIERGNLDGIMFALLVFGFNSKNWLLRSILLGASVATKVYSGLLFLLLLRRRRDWKIVAVGGLVFLALQLPFLHLLLSFAAAVSGRSGIFRIDENISPATLIYAFTSNLPVSKWLLISLWAATLAYRGMHNRDEDISISWPVYVPWMISLPQLVYPYSGVLALAPLVLIASETQNRGLLSSEKWLVQGFALLGLQAVAWSSFLIDMGKQFSGGVHLLCAIGTLWMLIGACCLPKQTVLLPDGI